MEQILHHGTDNTVLKKGQSIVIDIGGVYKSYYSDMTQDSILWV